jgi:hemoglobin
MKSAFRRAQIHSAVSALILAAGLSIAVSSTSAADKTLYERLGGQTAIVAVVDDFVGNVAADPGINGFFAHTDIARLKRNLVDQICAASGGPCTYTGRDMKTAHAGMGVQDMHFGALVGDLVKTLDKFKVPEKEKNELLAVLGPMKSDIVSK